MSSGIVHACRYACCRSTEEHDLEGSDVLHGDGALVLGAGDGQAALLHVQQARHQSEGVHAVRVLLVQHEAAVLGRRVRRPARVCADIPCAAGPGALVLPALPLVALRTPIFILTCSCERLECARKKKLFAFEQNRLARRHTSLLPAPIRGALEIIGVHHKQKGGLPGCLPCSGRIARWLAARGCPGWSGWRLWAAWAAGTAHALLCGAPCQR